MMLKRTIYLTILLILYCFSSNAIAQKVVFNLHYNDATQLYEVYGKADFSDKRFFVGGGSQLSIILPTNLVDHALDIQSVSGGPWADNSQVYAPTLDAQHDYHGIASNGSSMNFQKEVETLLFTFELPPLVDKEAVRLFDNQKDPHSNQAGMEGADFCNFFACALTVNNVYNGLYGIENIDLTNAQEAAQLPAILETTAVANFELYQNQPNPFKGTTTIEYVLPKAGNITLTLRDATGRVLKVIEEAGQLGQNIIRLNAKNLPRGWVHYQLDTPFGSKNRKMMLLK